MISQIALANSSYAECIAVSTTSDATGSYARYAFSFAHFNDYPKFGVWPDAYYASYNSFTTYPNGTWMGAQACAYDRAAMLAGRNASTVCFQRPPSEPGSLLPSDLDGSAPPPPGEPNFFVELATPSTLTLFRFHVDFRHPNNSSLTGPISINVAPFSTINSSVPQPGTTQTLWTLNRLMHRLA